MLTQLQKILQTTENCQISGASKMMELSYLSNMEKDTWRRGWHLKRRAAKQDDEGNSETGSQKGLQKYGCHYTCKVTKKAMVSRRKTEDKEKTNKVVTFIKELLEMLHQICGFDTLKKVS